MSREITVVSTQGGARVVLRSEATSWGQLKNEINREGSFNANDVKPLIRGTQQELNSDSDSLPTGDFTVFITPSKIKSGRSNNQVVTCF